MSDALELSIVIPCLNEETTVGDVVAKGVASLARLGVRGEVIVADNGSQDGSRDVACAAGARVVAVPTKGYGAALLGGIVAARGTYVLMADADDSYDLSAIDPFVDALRAGNDLVMGNRFKGGIDQGAMPTLHRYLGNPVLSFVARLFFGGKSGDFHCGMRAFRRAPILALDLRISRTCTSPRSPLCCIATAVPGVPTCAPGVMAGGTCGSCCFTARAGSSSIPARCSSSSARSWERAS